MMFLRVPTGDTELPVPRWADRAARAIPWVILPACLWRLPFGFGFTMGTRQSGSLPWWALFYVLTLSALSEGVALLSLALVNSWGETVPQRVPFIGGKAVRPIAAEIPAFIAGTALTGVTAQWVLGQVFGVVPRIEFISTPWRVLGTITSGLMVLWGPLLLAVTFAYHRRRRPAGASEASRVHPDE